MLAVAGVSPASASAAPRTSTADPNGGARWYATQSTGSHGRICAALRHGSKRKGKRCARLDGRLVYSFTVRTEGRPRPRDTRTVLLVLLTPDVVRAKLSTPDGPRTYRRRKGRARILLAVLAGRVERPPLRIEVHRGGRTSILNDGVEPVAKVADPFGGPAWRTVTAAGSGGGLCAAWQRVQPRYGKPVKPSRGTPRCGDEEADIPVVAAQVVDRRLVVFGRVGDDVSSAVLRDAAGRDTRVALEGRSRTILAVLPGSTDPAGLRLVVRRADGRHVERPLRVIG